jgi:hypothetical protein
MTVKNMGVLLHSPRSFIDSFLVVPSCFVGVAAATQTTKKMNRRTRTIYFTLSGIKKPSLIYLGLSYSTTLIFSNYVDCAHSTATLLRTAILRPAGGLPFIGRLP